MNKISELRKKNKLSQKEFGKIVGAAQNTVCNWENGKREPDNDTMIKISKLFNVSVDYLLGNEDNATSEQTESKYVKIPVLGYVAAGIPMGAIEDIVDWEEIPAEMARYGEYFGLIINGDSMEPRICRGDVVIVRKQSDIDSGDIAIVIVNGDEGTCKKVVKHDNGISLVSFNPAYEPMFYTWKEVEQLPIIINGKVVELRGKF